MPIARLTIRPTPGNRIHNLWLNNGTWWVHYTVGFDCRKRRIRRSLGTKDEAEAIRLRDELFAKIAAEGEFVRDRLPPTALPLLCWSPPPFGYLVKEVAR